MSTASVPPVALAAAGVGVALLAYAMIKKPAGTSLAQSVATGAVGAVADAGAGVVVGLGEVVGIPATNQDQCSIDLANGDYWAASFSCPASRFLGAVGGAVTGSTPSTPPANTGGYTGSW